MEVSVKIGDREFDAVITEKSGKYTVVFEDKVFNADFVSLNGQEGNLLINGKSYHVIFTDNAVYLNGKEYKVQTLDPLKKELLKSAKLEKDEGAVITSMPGNVKKVLVKEGDEVELGQPVIVLEAMKMENELEAPKSGKVKKVNVKEGASVEANAVLVEIE